MLQRCDPIGALAGSQAGPRHAKAAAATASGTSGKKPVATLLLLLLLLFLFLHLLLLVLAQGSLGCWASGGCTWQLWGQLEVVEREVLLRQERCCLGLARSCKAGQGMGEAMEGITCGSIRVAAV